MPSGIVGNGMKGNTANVDRNLLKIVVGPSTQPPSPIIDFPLNLLPSEQPPIADVDNTREKVFRQDSFFIPSSNKVEYVGEEVRVGRLEAVQVMGTGPFAVKSKILYDDLIKLASNSEGKGNNYL